MVLKEVEVSQIIKCSFVPYIQLCCAGLPFKSHFKSIKNKLFICLQCAVANGLERSLNISNPLEMLVCEFGSL